MGAKQKQQQTTRWSANCQPTQHVLSAMPFRFCRCMVSRVLVYAMGLMGLTVASANLLVMPNPNAKPVHVQRQCQDAKQNKKMPISKIQIRCVVKIKRKCGNSTYDVIIIKWIKAYQTIACTTILPKFHVLSSLKYCLLNPIGTSQRTFWHILSKVSTKEWGSYQYKLVRTDNVFSAKPR